MAKQWSLGSATTAQLPKHKLMYYLIRKLCEVHLQEFDRVKRGKCYKSVVAQLVEITEDVHVDENFVRERQVDCHFRSCQLDSGRVRPHNGSRPLERVSDIGPSMALQGSRRRIYEMVARKVGKPEEVGKM
jgi:hypothetical protein